MYRLDGPASATPAYAYPEPVFRYDLAERESGAPFHALLLTVPQATELRAQLEQGARSIERKCHDT